MVPNIEEKSKSPDSNDMNEEEKKISNILSKLSVDKTKELSSLSSDQITALVKLVAVMEQNQIDAFLEMSMDKIKEMINEAMD
jgi:helix-turn-helix protein